MSHIALYRKWRPQVFEDVVEQTHVVKTLKYSVASGRIAHAYLFCGTRGTGKTTMAKIFARAINCLNSKDGDPCNECDICKGILSENLLDVIEIDAASNNSVDNVRSIRDEVVYTPSQAKYKVYIIDEVHMLSTGAFNALLKTLEEPPSHVVFILATTDPHKLPATILSRCQRFDFRRITIESIMERISEIAENSVIEIASEATRLIARMADGALRDAISILDQCISTGSKSITYTDVLSIVGIVNDSFVSDLVEVIKDRDINRLFDMVQTLVMDGKDITQFVSDLVLYYRNMLICKMLPDPTEIIDTSPEGLARLKELANSFERQELISTIKELSALESSLKWAAHPRILLEVALIRLCDGSFNADTASLSERLALLESKLANGQFVLNTVPGNGGSGVSSETAGYDVDIPAAAKHPSKNKALSTAQQQGSGTHKKETLAIWSDIVNDLKSSGRMALYAYLIDTKAVMLGDSLVGIVLDGGGKGHIKMVLSKQENLKILENAVGKRLGREVRVKSVDEDSLGTAGGAVKAEERDELVDKARDIASRLNIPLNIIDE